jgi:hypothetical protein
MIMRLRHANIRLINRRSKLPRLLLALPSKNGKSNNKDKNNPTYAQGLTGSLHIRACSPPVETPCFWRPKGHVFDEKGHFSAKKWPKT